MKNNNLVEILSRRFNDEEVYLLLKRQTTRKREANWFFFTSSIDTSHRSLFCMIENVINFVIFFVAFFLEKRSSLFCVRYERKNIFKYYIRFSIHRKTSKRKQSNLGNPHFYCFAVRFDVILSYTLQLWRVECLHNFQSHHHKELSKLVEDFRQM